MKHLLLLGSVLAASSFMGYAATPVTIAPEGGDITEALNTAKEAAGEVGNIVINLKAGASYTVSGSLVAPAGIIVNGNGANINAADLQAPFILMDTVPAVEVVNDFYRVDSVMIDNVNLTNVNGSLFYDNNTKYCVVDFTISGSTIALTTTAVENEAIVSFKSGGAKDFTMVNNTVYGNNEVAKYFIRYNNNSRLDRYGFDKDTEFQTMTYTANTFYGLLKEDGQWGNYNGISGQKYSKFDVQKNIWYNCGNDIIRRMAGGRFNGSNPMEFAYNTYFNNGVSTAESEGGYDKSETILTTNPGFADAAAGNFTISGTSEQAEYQTGAEKWRVGYDIHIFAESGDPAAAVAAAKEGVLRVGNIYLYLLDGETYTIGSPLVVPAGLVIYGNNATIDAAGLEAPFILMDAEASAPLVNDYYRVNEMKIFNVNLINLANSIFYDNNVKYCVVDFNISNSTIALATTAVENEALISFKAGGAKDFTMVDNTVYGNNEVAKYFIRYNNSARLDRYGFDKDTEFQTMTYTSNTFYGLLKSDGQWGNYNGVQGQKYSAFDVQKNIWYNCGNDIIRRMAGGRFNNDAPLTFAYNTYFNDGVNIGEAEASYDKSETILTTNPGFADAAAGNFTIGANTEQAKYQTGAEKWLVPYNQGGTDAISSVASDDTPAEYYNLQGIRVENPENGIFIRKQGTATSKVIIK